MCCIAVLLNKIHSYFIALIINVKGPNQAFIHETNFLLQGVCVNIEMLGL